MRRTEELIEILCGFISDIQSSIELVKDLEMHNLYGENLLYRQGAYRVCLNAIFLSLAKYIEFNKKYGDDLNRLVAHHNADRKHWTSEFNKRDIFEFRNKFLAHVSCKTEKRTLTYAELDEFVKKICGGNDALSFFEWLSPEDCEGGFIAHVQSMKDDLHAAL